MQRLILARISIIHSGGVWYTREIVAGKFTTIRLDSSNSVNINEPALLHRSEPCLASHEARTWVQSCELRWVTYTIHSTLSTFYQTLLTKSPEPMPQSLRKLPEPCHGHSSTP